MPRPESLIDPDWPLAGFASGLRALRKMRGITYKEMSGTTHYSVATLSSAARGLLLPTLEVTLAYFVACNGPRDHWARYWAETRYSLLLQKGRGIA
jgi:transcriptional regulator with XRE-family HTH domain